MAQKREKDETLELKVPTDAPLSLSCPDNCKISPNPPGFPGSTGPDPPRMDSCTSDKAEPSMPRSDKHLLEREAQAQAAAEVAEHPRVPTGDRSPTTATAAVVAKKAVKRCSGCGKRVGLTGFRCRCGDLFCSEHRYSDRHDCSYDYKAAGREAIARENPVVRAAKILKV